MKVFFLMKALYYLLSSVSIVITMCTAMFTVSSEFTQLPEPEEARTELVREYDGDFLAFKQELITNYLRWEITTPEARVRAKNVLELLLKIQAISQDDFDWFVADLEKRAF